MILLYILLGIILAITGATPIGASNIAVITTSKKSYTKAIQIAKGAGLGEVVLAFLALWYTQLLCSYFEMNTWIQISFVALFFILGMAFILSKNLNFKLPFKLKRKGKYSTYLTGFILALLNPPVLIFWMVGISLAQKYVLPISNMSSITIVVLFLVGVYSGKYLTLFLYGKLGRVSTNKPTRNPHRLHQFIGIALLLLSTIQGIRIWF